MTSIEPLRSFLRLAFIHINERSILFLIALRDAAADIAWINSLRGSSHQQGQILRQTPTPFHFSPHTCLHLQSFWSCLLPAFRRVITIRHDYRQTFAPGLRRSFFETAANILLRPFPQIDQSSAGRLAHTSLPLDCFHASSNLLPTSCLLSPLNSLRWDQRQQEPRRTPATLRSTGEWATTVSEFHLKNELKDRLDRAQDADARDRAYAHAAMSFAGEGDPRAQEFVNKIEDLETRKGVASFCRLHLDHEPAQKEAA